MKTILQLLTNKVNFLIFTLSTAVLAYFYYIALTARVSWEVFIASNSTLFILLQVILSIANAALGGISILLIIRIFKDRKAQGKLSFVQTFSALFFSILTTGCYVCGTLLLPAIGLASSFATLPFAGLEVKVLTALFLVYSLTKLVNNYKGICEIESDKVFKISFGSSNLLFKFKYIQRLKPFLITSLFIISIFALPAILPNNLNQINNAMKCNGINCSCNIDT